MDSFRTKKPGSIKSKIGSVLLRVQLRWNGGTLSRRTYLGVELKLRIKRGSKLVATNETLLKKGRVRKRWLSFSKLGKRL